MAIAIKSADKYNRAKAEAAKNGGDLFEIYKRLGGAFVEGTNEEIDGMYKVIGIFDDVKAKKPAKKAKKLGSAKKKKR